MNFNEWCKQISRELGTRVHREDVYTIMYTAFRVAMEEFAISPDNAELFIYGIGRFYLNVERHRNYLGEAYGQEPYRYIRTIRFVPSRMLKDTIRGERRLEDLAIGQHFLFPEFHMDEEGNVYHVDGTATKYYEKKREVRHTNEYWIKHIKLLQQGKEILNEDGSFSKIKQKKPIPYERRGRPALKLTPAQVRQRVMTEMRRELRREKRNQRKELEQKKKELEDEQQLWRELETDKTRKGSESEEIG